MTMSWRLLRSEIKTLLKGHGKNAHRVAEIVLLMFKSDRFLDEAHSGNIDARDDELSSYSGSYGIGLNDMIQMINHFPKSKDWENGRLDIIRDKTLTILTKRSGEPTQQRRSARVAEVDQLKRKVKSLQSRIRELEQENERLKKLLGKGGEGRRGKAA